MRGDEIVSYKTDKYILKYYDVKDKDLYWQYIDNPEIIIKNAEIPIIECYAVLQDHYYNNEILTIIVSGKENDYIIYNIDMNSLEFLSNEDILNLMGLNSDDMKNIIKNNTIKLVNQIYTGNDLKNAIEYIKNNKNEDNAFFFDWEGRFSFKSKYPNIINGELLEDSYFYNYEGNTNYYYCYYGTNRNYIYEEK